MSTLDWVGLWAMLEVIGSVIGLVSFVVFLVVGIVYVLWGLRK